MAKAGVLRYDSLSNEDAAAFLAGKAILQPGFVMLVESDNGDEAIIYFGVGKGVAETPGINAGMLSRIVALEAVTPDSPPWPISYITNLQAALDSKAALVHYHDIADITGLQGVLDAMYEPGVTDVDEGTLG